MIHSFFGSAVRCLLSGEWCSFARSFEAHGSCAGPGNDIALIIGNRNDRVVEGRVDMNHALGNVLSPAFFASDTFAGLLLRLAFSFWFFIRGVCHNLLLLALRGRRLLAR